MADHAWRNVTPPNRPCPHRKPGPPGGPRPAPHLGLGEPRFRPLSLRTPPPLQPLRPLGRCRGRSHPAPQGPCPLWPLPRTVPASSGACTRIFPRGARSHPVQAQEKRRGSTPPIPGVTKLQNAIAPSQCSDWSRSGHVTCRGPMSQPCCFSWKDWGRGPWGFAELQAWVLSAPGCSCHPGWSLEEGPRPRGSSHQTLAPAILKSVVLGLSNFSSVHIKRCRVLCRVCPGS